MTYDPSVPQPRDFLDESQPEIKENFTQIQSLIEINHEGFSSANIGKHKFVTLVKRADGPSTVSNETAIFCVNDSGSRPCLFFREQGVAEDGPKTQMSPFPGVFAWCSFDYAGVLSGPNYNVGSITVAGTDPNRTYKLNFTNPLVSMNYFPSIAVVNTAAADATYGNATAFTANDITIKFFKSLTTTAPFTTATVILWGIP